MPVFIDKLINCFTDKSGSLYPLSMDELPFVPQRIFFVAGQSGAIRGQHAHQTCEQYLVCISGFIGVEIFDGEKNHTVKMVRGCTLHIPAGIYATQRYMISDSVLLVFCSEKYDEKDYIRGMDNYKKSLTTSTQ